MTSQNSNLPLSEFIKFLDGKTITHNGRKIKNNFYDKVFLSFKLIINLFIVVLPFILWKWCSLAIYPDKISFFPFVMFSLFCFPLIELLNSLINNTRTEFLLTRSLINAYVVSIFNFLCRLFLYICKRKPIFVILFLLDSSNYNNSIYVSGSLLKEPLSPIDYSPSYVLELLKQLNSNSPDLVENVLKDPEYLKKFPFLESVKTLGQY